MPLARSLTYSYKQHPRPTSHLLPEAPVIGYLDASASPAFCIFSSSSLQPPLQKSVARSFFEVPSRDQHVNGAVHPFNAPQSLICVDRRPDPRPSPPTPPCRTTGLVPVVPLQPGIFVRRRHPPTTKHISIPYLPTYLAHCAPDGGLDKVQKGRDSRFTTRSLLHEDPRLSHPDSTLNSTAPPPRPLGTVPKHHRYTAKPPALL
jgi:hypothetical protein